MLSYAVYIQRILIKRITAWLVFESFPNATQLAIWLMRLLIITVFVDKPIEVLNKG